MISAAASPAWATPPLAQIPRMHGKNAGVVPLFEFDHVEVRRGGVPVLVDVSAQIPDRAATAIVGHSGSGKSTLLRCCNRLEVPSSGVVRFRGVDVATLDPLELRRTVAMVFQQPTVFPGTVLDNLRVGAPRLSERDARALLDHVALDDRYLLRDARSLSGGEAQRLVIARALATEPSVLLADEPTSALDEESTERLEALGAKLAADGIPIVWVTHDLRQAHTLADHLIEMAHGRVVWSGPVEHRKEA